MLLKDYAENGLPLKDIFVVDMHCHLGQYYDYYIPFSDEREQFSEFVRTMDRMGVNHSCISMIRAINGNLETNYTLAEYMGQEDRIFGWITYSPHTPEQSLEVIEKCLGMNKRFIGVKIHPAWNSYALNWPDYYPLWEYADSKGLMILSHTWYEPNCDPALLKDIAGKYKNITFLLGHSGGQEPGITHAVDLVNSTDNVYMDLTGAFIYSNVWLENYAKRVDVKRMLFSSDTVFNNIGWEIGNILYSRIPDEAKLDILGLNAKRLLKI